LSNQHLVAAYARPVAGRLSACVAAVAGGLVLAGGGGGVAQAQVDGCPAPPYPGDHAPRDQIAQWMGYGAALAALPRELPLMAALGNRGARTRTLRITG
jgi:hypothetical protein